MSPTPTSLKSSFPYVHSTLIPYRPPRRRSLTKPTAAAPATGIVASVLIPTRRVNHLLVCSSHEFDGERRHFVLRGFYWLRLTLFPPSFGVRWKRFLRMFLCPFSKCPPGLFWGCWERNQRLVSEGTAIQTERSSHAHTSAGISKEQT